MPKIMVRCLKLSHNAGYFFLPAILGRVDEKAAQLHAIASLQAMMGGKSSFVDGVNGNNPMRTNPGGPEVRSWIS